MKQAIVFAAALLLVSCATTDQAAGPVAEVNRNLQPGDMLAHGALEVVSARMIEAPGYRGCAIELRNPTTQPVSLIGLVRWYERDGAEARKGRPAWRRVTVPAGASVTIPSVAPVPWCTEFGLELRSSL